MATSACTSPSRRRLLLVGASAALCGLAPAVMAAGSALAASDTKPAPAPDPVPPLFAATAALYAIPPGLFYAIALQESGRRGRPWPWTLNVAGAGSYYPSLGAVWDALNGFVLQRPRNIGVGYMQLTWPYNLHLLTDLYLALEPRENLRLAATLLRANYEETGSWWQATAFYHSRTPWRGRDYAGRVRRHLSRLGLDPEGIA